jgi:hypothetical protein
VLTCEPTLLALKVLRVLRCEREERADFSRARASACCSLALGSE